MSTRDLTVRFLGVRGSIATPGPDKTAGGNTACIEVCAGDTRIILDAGTGLRVLGDERMKTGPRHSTILLSHLHWDHVAGLPFFVPGHRVGIASGPNGVMPLEDSIPRTTHGASRRDRVPRAPGGVGGPPRYRSWA